jgi:transposase
MVHMPESDEIEALKKALAEAMGELRVVRTERDLLKEQLNHFKRQLFAARSEAGATHQKDLFFNEAEVEGRQAQPAGEESDDGKVEVPAHKRAKRGRKPLDPALPREVTRRAPVVVVPAATCSAPPLLVVTCAVDAVVALRQLRRRPRLRS